METTVLDNSNTFLKETIMTDHTESAKELIKFCGFAHKITENRNAFIDLFINNEENSKIFNDVFGNISDEQK